MICSICHEELNAKHGNNAAPINDGRCCDRCNSEVVIPARIAAAMGPRSGTEPKKTRVPPSMDNDDPTGLIIHRTDGTVEVFIEGGKTKVIKK
jgi:hypothetical protein